MSQSSDPRLLLQAVDANAKGLASPAFAKNSNWMSYCAKRIRSIDAAPLPSGRWVALLAVACLVAIGASGYLGWVALTSSKVAGCGGGRLFNCGHVISSRWSLWMGIPVSLMAVGLYFTMACSLLVGASSRFSNRARHLGWAVVSVLAISAGLAAVWFISLQVFVLNHLCTYCLVAHTCGLIAAAAVIWLHPIGVLGMRSISILSFAGVVILIGGQLLTEAPKTYQIEQFEAPASANEASEFQAPVFDAPVFDAPVTAKPTAAIELRSHDIRSALVAVLRPSKLITAQVSVPSKQNTTSEAKQTAQINKAKTKVTKPIVEKVRRFIPINGGTAKLDVAQWPLAGSQSAKYIFAEMFDYSCPHCRHTHAGIKKASELLGGDMAIVVLPIPLNTVCNGAIQVTDPKFLESCQIAKLAVAVWRVEPVKFNDFHEWMFLTEAAPNYAAAKAHAETLVDVEKLNAEIASEAPSQYIAQTVELYRRAGSGNVPKLIFPTTTIVGEFTSGESLAGIVKSQIR